MYLENGPKVAWDSVGGCGIVIGKCSLSCGTHSLRSPRRPKGETAPHFRYNGHPSAMTEASAITDERRSVCYNG